MKNRDLTQALYARFFNFTPKKGDVRRMAIIEAALDCIAAQGVEAISFESLGQRIGMQRAHVAYYFPEREDIIESAIKFVVNTAQSFTVESVQKAQDDRDRLHCFIRGAFDWMETFPKHGPTVVLFYHYTCFKRKYRKLHDEIRQMGAERLVEIISPLISGTSRSDLLRIATSLQNLITGNLIFYGTTNTELSLQDLCARTIHDAETLLFSTD